MSLSIGKPGPRGGADQRAAWSTAEIVSAAVLGVAGGVLLVALNAAYGPMSAWAYAVYPPVEGMFTGLYVLPAVLGGLLVRRPGAAVFTMVVAAVVSMLVGNLWGFQTFFYGLVQGLGAELAFAALRYRRWGLPVSLAAGLGAAVGESLLTIPLFYAGVGADQQAARVGVGLVSGLVLAGVGSWALARALAQTGALRALRSGRDAERV